MNQQPEQNESSGAKGIESAPWRSLVPLVLANLIPLGGVVLDGWPLFPVMLLFSLENLAIGIFGVLRMLPVKDDEAKTGQIIGFIFIYGGFTLSHLAFVLILFGGDDVPPIEWPTDMVVTMCTVVIGALNPFSAGEVKLWMPMFGFFISHGISYVVNYLGRREYERTQIGLLVFRPFGRVVVLHVTVIIGGGLVTLTGSHVVALVLLVLLKTGVDIRSHCRERSVFANPPAYVRRKWGG